MTSRWIESVRSVELEVADLDRAEAFYTGTWHLEVAHRTPRALHLRGTGDDPCLLVLHAGGDPPMIRHVTLRARSADALAAVADATLRAGGRVESPIGPVDDPAGGVGLVLQDPHGRRFQVIHGDRRPAARAPVADRPIRLTHVVLNSHDADATRRFLETAFDFRLADLTGAIAFMNCNADHHTLAVGIADNDALNHIAFLMPDLDSVMRGGGRMKDAGHPIEWGPGRHGPGNNLFNYFVDPFGIVIEYTADVLQVDDGYVAHGPEHWRWRAGRFDHWGISPAPSAALKAAQRRVNFVAPSQ